MDKREWGRRRSDGQAYPKTRGKEALPRGLTIVPQTRRIRIEENLGKLEKVMTDLGQAITDAESERNADAIYSAIYHSYGHDMAENVWDNYVNWDDTNWGDRERIPSPTRRAKDEEPMWSVEEEVEDGFRGGPPRLSGRRADLMDVFAKSGEDEMRYSVIVDDFTSFLAREGRSARKSDTRQRKRGGPRRKRITQTMDLNLKKLVEGGYLEKPERGLYRLTPKGSIEIRNQGSPRPRHRRTSVDAEES